MLQSVFKAVLVMSAVSGALAAVLLLLKPFTQKIFGQRWQYFIWYAVLFAALVPVSITLPKMHAPRRVLVYEQPVVPESFDKTLPMQTAALGAGDTAVSSASFMSAISYIWLIAALYCMVSAIAEYMLFIRAIRKNSTRDGKYKGISVLSTDLLSAPLTVGLFKKTILIPRYIESIDEKNHILLHEYTHIRHHDIFYKWLCMAVRCIHWFNPFMYMVSSAIDEQCEIMCDTSVTRGMDETEKKKYMNIILSLISRTAPSCRLTTRMADSKHSLTKRFAAITAISTRGKLTACVSTVMGAAVFFLVMFASGIAGSAAYDSAIPALSLDFSFDFSQETQDEQAPHQSNAPQDDFLELYSPKNEDKQSDIEEKTPLLYEESIDDTQGATMTETGEVSDGEAAQSVEAAPADDFWVYETDHSTDVTYPVFGEIYIGESDMNTVIGKIQKDGGVKSGGDETNLSMSYYSDTLSYESGNISKVSNVKCNENGMIQFYMESDYEQFINISIEYEGRQISGNGIIPDNGTVYAIGGLDPEKTYDITVANLAGDTWKTTGQYVIY